MSVTTETITCGTCGHSFDSDEEKNDHVKASHTEPKTWEQRAISWAEKML
ncbi:MAG: hypothetical protein ACXADC_16765 [Candidatus Thorarchaeota archaeon]|jgi:hypothetical protein